MKNIIAFLALAISTAASVNASVIYTVSINTSAISGQSGYLDFQFNPGDISSQTATAMVSNFASVSGVLGTATLSGGVSPVNASLPAAFTLTNSTQFNDLFQTFTFGSSLTFRVTLAGGAVDAPNGTAAAGSAFGFSLYAADQATPLLTSDSNGTVADLLIDTKGAVTPQTFMTGSGGMSVAALSQVVTPEPTSLLLLSIGIVSFAAVGARSRRQR